MQTQKVIERLGFSANEAKVYLAALKLGEAHASDIAARLKLPRSSVGLMLEKLHKEGLMSFYVRKRYKHWVVQRPEHLIELLEARQDELRQIYDDILETRRHFMTINHWDEWVELLGRGFMDDFITQRVARGLRVRIIAPRTALTAALRVRDGKDLRDMRFAPPDAAPGTAVFVWGDKTAIVSLNKRLPTGVVIEDPDIRATAELFFEELWNRSQ